MAEKELETYRRKRDFGRTPEPAGRRQGRSKREGRLGFVVQKHDARRLHYDFRLELDGALKSWAVPKGPSLDPAERRLAIRTEDHPLEYASFEGIIPAGEYGGGTVVVWDRGRWYPRGDPRAALDRGRLKFRLEGEKLTGSWALVRTGGRGGDKEEWLLIKERDEHARPGSGTELVEDRPESVLTGRDLAGVASAGDRVWHSDRSGEHNARKPASGHGSVVDPARIRGARKASLPRTPRAQLATLAPDAPQGAEWTHEIKLDGYRLLARIDGGEIRLLTRNEKDWTERFPSVVASLRALPCRAAILDGEVAVLDQHGVSHFQMLQNLGAASRSRRLFYFIFDLLHLDGYDLTDVPLRTRKDALSELLNGAGGSGDVLRYSQDVAGSGPGFHAEACRLGVEGIISKRLDAPYRPGRGRDWLKVKCMQRQEFIVVGYSDPSGSRQGLGALLLGVFDDGKAGSLIYAGKVGTGFTDRTLRELRERLEPLERSTPPVADPPRGARARGVHWVEPRLVAEVAFTEWTSDGKVRHPSYQGLREDKDPEEVVRERGTVGHAGSPGNQRARSEVAGVRLSNPGRVLFPEQGLTKLALAEYYEAVAGAILPHIQRRPLSLVRCPAGRQAHCFFQKHANDSIPDVVPRVFVEEAGEPEPYMMVDGLSSLIALVQLGVLEFHIWGSRADRLERPDRMVIDLDPDEGLPWRRVVAAAERLRERLTELGLQSFPMTTGGKGLHVVIPLVRRSSWDEVKDFGRALAEEFVHEAPDRFTAKMTKASRRGRIYVDYLRNGRGATAICPYSTRARAGAPVAVPIGWEEVGKVRGGSEFDVRSAIQRLDRGSGDPWATEGPVRQSLTKAMLKEVGLA